MADMKDISNILKLSDPDKREYTQTYMKTKNCKELFQKYLDDLNATSSLDDFGKNNSFLLKRTWSLNKDAKHLHKNKLNVEKALDPETGAEYCEGRLDEKTKALAELARRAIRGGENSPIKSANELADKSNIISTGALQFFYSIFNKDMLPSMRTDIITTDKFLQLARQCTLGENAADLLVTAGYHQHAYIEANLSQAITPMSNLIQKLESNANANHAANVDWSLIYGSPNKMEDIDIVDKIVYLKDLYNFAYKFPVPAWPQGQDGPLYNLSILAQYNLVNASADVRAFLSRNREFAVLGENYLKGALLKVREANSSTEIEAFVTEVLKAHDVALKAMVEKQEQALNNLVNGREKEVDELTIKCQTARKRVSDARDEQHEAYNQLTPPEEKRAADQKLQNEENALKALEAELAKLVDPAELDSLHRHIIETCYRYGISNDSLEKVKYYEDRGLLQDYVRGASYKLACDRAKGSIRVLRSWFEREIYGVTVKQLCKFDSRWTTYLQNWRTVASLCRSSYILLQQNANMATAIYQLYKNFHRLCISLRDEARNACRNYQPPKKQSSKNKNAVKAILKAKQEIDSKKSAMNIGKTVVTAMQAMLKDFNDPSVSKSEIKNLYTAIQNKAKNIK